MSHYQYVLSFELAGDCPPEVSQFFEQLAADGSPETLPQSDEQAMEAPAAEVIALMAGSTRIEGTQVMIVGTATAEQFFMPFMALAEWLARWSATRGPVGFYHQSALAHPTLLYLTSGKPYMLQTTGTPVGLADGEQMPGDVEREEVEREEAGPEE